MPQGEASKRRQGRGITWASPTSLTISLATAGTIVDTAIPAEATHMRVVNTIGTAGNWVRIGFDGSTPTATVGIVIPTRVAEFIPIPPGATVLRATLAVTAATDFNVWFVAKED